MAIHSPDLPRALSGDWAGGSDAGGAAWRSDLISGELGQRDLGERDQNIFPIDSKLSALFINLLMFSFSKGFDLKKSDLEKWLVSSQVRHTTTSYLDIEFAPFRSNPQFIQACHQGPRGWIESLQKQPIWKLQLLFLQLYVMPCLSSCMWCGSLWFSTQLFPSPSSSRSTLSYTRALQRWTILVVYFSSFSASLPSPLYWSNKNVASCGVEWDEPRREYLGNESGEWPGGKKYKN